MKIGIFIYRIYFYRSKDNLYGKFRKLNKMFKDIRISNRSIVINLCVYFYFRLLFISILIVCIIYLYKFCIVFIV